MNSLFEELRHALRSLRKQPGFFFTAVLTMTLGIDAGNPLLLIVVVAVLASIALVACSIPSLRATTITPLEALRDE